MPYSASRMTLYALISSVEDDLRAFVQKELLIQEGLNRLISKDVLKKLTRRERIESSICDQQPTDFTLVEYMDFAEAIEVINAHTEKLSKEIQDSIKQIRKIFTPIIPIRNRVMHSRPLQAEDFPYVNDAARKLYAEWPNLFAELGLCIKKLESNPEFVLGLDIPQVKSHERISSNLPMPDFDDTGFIGRKKESKKIKDLIYGAYPVISLVGVGGIGKSALAVNVAYDILDDPRCPFESIIWVSSKTTMLGNIEIKRIENSISDSLGMFNKVAEELGAQENSFDEIYEYMKEFKILLILDNLETVLDQRLRDFLKDLPAGSKLLITSRISVGAYDFPYKVEAMDEKESVKLLRLLAEIRSAPVLAKAKQILLENYVHRMKCNPGFIKWFVTAVSLGEEPGKLLVDPKLFLEFCMQNVYEHLSENARTILGAMVISNSMHSLSMLHYLTEIDAVGVETALLGLLASNMINMQIKDSFTVYKVSDIPRLYLKKFHKPDADLIKKIHARRKAIVSSTEDMERASKAYPYNFKNISIPAPYLRVVAKYLGEAIRHIRQDRPQEATKLIENAKAVESNYYEVHRVEAMYFVGIDDMISARASYELAIDINPESGPLRLWFGGFLMRFCDENVSAIEHFKIGRKADPKHSYLFDIEITRANLYLKRFDEAEKIIGSLSLEKDRLDERSIMILSSLELQFFKRKAEYLIDQREFIAGLECLDALIRCFENMSELYKDDTNIKTVLSSEYHLNKLVQSCYGNRVAPPNVQITYDRLRCIKRLLETKRMLEAEGVINGIVVRLKKDRRFGFIKADDGQEHYFHQAHLTSGTDFDSLEEHATRVRFVVGEHDKRRCATEVSVIACQKKEAVCK